MDDAIESALAEAHNDYFHGRLRAARRQLLQILRRARHSFGPRHPRVAEVLNQLGMVGKAERRFADAERRYREALGILRATRGRGRLEIADLYHNLAGLEHARGRYGRGEPLARRGIQLRARRHGANATVAWLDRAAHAAILDGLGRFAESEPVYRQALKVFRRRLGPDHYEIAVTLNNLGCVRAERGDLRESASLLAQAVKLKERQFGRASPEVALTLLNLSRTLNELGQLPRARLLRKRAEGILRKTGR